MFPLFCAHFAPKPTKSGNVQLALGISDQSLILESGQTVAEGNAKDILENHDLISTYLG